ncbi:MAG: hypothetical protein HY267_05810 [Deltaproteobacteria bacterium]|nr:hypothetical protein [Deltaproteobacteria bacterium]
MISKLSVIRFLGFLPLLLCLCLNGAALAQPSPYGSQSGNLGAWTWGKQQPPPEQDEDAEPEAPQATEGAEKADGSDETGEATARERGGTSWERLQADREPAPTEEEQKTMTPLDVWRRIREKLW